MTPNTPNKCTNGQISVCTCWSTPQMLCLNKLKPCFTGPKSCEGHAVAIPCTPAGQGMVQHHAGWPSFLLLMPGPRHWCGCQSLAAQQLQTWPPPSSHLQKHTHTYTVDRGAQPKTQVIDVCAIERNQIRHSSKEPSDRERHQDKQDTRWSQEDVGDRS